MANFIVNDIKNAFKPNGNALTQIIIINVAVFLLVNIINALILFSGGAPHALVGWLALPADLSDLLFRPWTLVTYMFLHLGIVHIFFNMLILYFIGRILRDYIGDRKVVGAYILGGVSAGILFLVFYNLVNVFSSNVPGFELSSVLLGASGGVMAVVFATGTLVPNQPINLFLLGSIRMKYIAFGLLILTTFIDLASNTGGKIAHMGGALFGYIYMKQMQQGKDYSLLLYKIIDSITGIFKPSAKRPKMKVKYRRAKTDAAFNQQKAKKQEAVDIILDKISKSGYESLTKEEKDFLFKASNE